MRIVYLEPFEGGSHAAFTERLTEGVAADWCRLTLPGRHWKWRMRGSAAYFAQAHLRSFDGADLLFASSYVPLAELVGLVPALRDTPRVLYFHENQLTYPNREARARDHHFGFTQLVSALAAHECWFNSDFNRTSFLEAGAALLARMPDAHPPGFVEAIAAKSRVMPVLIRTPPWVEVEPDGGAPIVLWNHRWEHDKDPETFFEALEIVAARGVPFRLAVAGTRNTSAPPVFERARHALRDHLVHFGPADRATYEQLLRRADLAVSTARHEFFGIAMLEATHFGACPLVPDDLAYPELFDAQYRYPRGALVEALVARLTQRAPLRADRRAITAPFGPPLARRYAAELDRVRLEA